MKKIFAFLLAFVMVLSFAACGNKGNGEESGSKDSPSEDSSSNVETVDKKFNLDMKSTKTQPMSDERATKKVLSDTVNIYLGGNTFFTGTEQEKLTYADFAEHIGCDASEYQYDADNSSECYTWIAKEDETAKLSVWICEGKLLYTGSTQL